MATTVLHRVGGFELAVRDSGDGRTLFGVVAPFGTPARVSDGGPMYKEQFERGAFARTIRERGDSIRLNVAHDGARRLPIGRATLLREDAAGLYGEFKVSKTTAGEEALELARDGAVSFSVGFQPID